MRPELVLVLVLLAGPAGVGRAGAETAVGPAGCADLTAVVEAAVGGDLTMPPAAAQDGWCVLDGARSVGDAAVRVSVETLRVRGEAAGEELLSLELVGKGVRVTPALNGRDLPGWLRDLLRLQSAEVDLSLRHDEAGNRLLLERGHLGLSGGSELVLTGEIAGAGLSAAPLVTGRVTALTVDWKNDGRTLRPVMEAMGAGLEPEATGTKAVLAARKALSGLVEAVPQGSLPDDSADALSALIAALPQGRGRLLLTVGSDSGIGMAQLGFLALSDDPLGSEALARLFSGVAVGASWTPGISP